MSDAPMYALHYSNSNERTSPRAVAVSTDIESLKDLAQEIHHKNNFEPAGVFRGVMHEAEIPDPLEWSSIHYPSEGEEWDAVAGFEDDDWWQIYTIKVV